IFPQTFNQIYPLKVDITNYGKTPVKVLSATVDDPKLTTKVVETTGKYSVEVMAEQGHSLEGSKTLLIKTDDPEIKEIRVPVYSIKTGPGLPPLTAKPSIPSANMPAGPKVKVGGALVTPPTATRPAGNGGK